MRQQTFARYGNTNVPRYTSYPTAPNFSPDITEADYRHWLRGLTADLRTSLYIHLPFCRSMCWYCGCHTTVAVRQEPIERYLSALQQEAKLLTTAVPQRLKLNYLHFGGGTPSLISPSSMRALMTTLRDGFEFAHDAEVAIEVDPRTLTKDMAAGLGDCGFNRASLGVQSFDGRVQRAINRIQSYGQTKAATRMLRANGIASINFDLIYGLPLQTARSCVDTVEKALRLDPDRLSVFGYAHVPAFKPHQRKIRAEDLPGTDERLTQALAFGDTLRAAGYVAIGLDHYAKPDDALARATASGTLHRNFQGYTTDDSRVLLGLGASAIGRLPAGYVQNVVPIADYERRVLAGELPIARGYALTSDDLVRGAIIERLMCDREVDVHAICAAFSADPDPILLSADLGPLISDGLIERASGIVRVKPEAYPLLRSVASAFDAYLAGTRGRHARAV